MREYLTDVSTSPSNKKVTIANVFNKIPTFIGYGADSVETVHCRWSFLHTQIVIYQSFCRLEQLQLQNNFSSDVSQVGFTKHIIRAGTSSGVHDVDLILMLVKDTEVAFDGTETFNLSH